MHWRYQTFKTVAFLLKRTLHALDKERALSFYPR